MAKEPTPSSHMTHVIGTPARCVDRASEQQSHSWRSNPGLVCGSLRRFARFAKHGRAPRQRIGSGRGAFLFIGGTAMCRVCRLVALTVLGLLVAGGSGCGDPVGTF